jgi:hypothetical protein
MAKRTSEQRSDQTLDMADAIREAEGEFDLPDRYTADGIAKRREQVWKFMARRVPQTVMADLLGVSRKTINADVKFWRENCQEQVELMKNDPLAASADIGLTAMRLEGMAQRAMNEAELQESGPSKNLFLNTAMRAEGMRADILTKTGVWPKAGEDIRVSHNIKATFTAKMGEDSPLASLDDPSSRRRVLTAAEQILKLTTKKGLSDDDLPFVILDDDDDPRTIDIDAQVKDVG